MAIRRVFKCMRCQLHYDFDSGLPMPGFDGEVLTIAKECDGCYEKRFFRGMDRSGDPLGWKGVQMPRMHGIREVRDKCFYDTTAIGRNRSVRMFGNANIGRIHRTNLQVAGFLGNHDGAFVIRAIGVRCLGKSRAEEDILLDHIHVNFCMGGRPQLDILGPHASMLRHVFSQEEIERLRLECDDHKPWQDDCKPAAERRLGYHLARPIIVPCRQSVSVEVLGSEWLREEVAIRVFLFGLQTRDVQ